MSKFLIRVDSTKEINVFEIGKTKGHTYSIDIGQIVSKTAEGFKCSCSLFRFKKTCKHIEALGTAGVDWVWKGVQTCGDYTKAEFDDSIQVEEGDVGIVVVDTTKASPYHNRPLLIEPVSSKVHATEVFKILFDEEPKHLSDLGSSGDMKTCSRLSEELMKMYSEGLDLHDSTSHMPASIACTARVVSSESFETGDPEDADTITARKSRKAVRKVPKPKGFFVHDDVWDALTTCLQTGKHVLLHGPTGSGKSELVAFACEALELDYEPINFGAMSEARTSLIGATHFNPANGTLFKPSRFVAAFTKPEGCILLDEITRAPADAFNIILPAMDRQGYISLDESEDAEMVFKGDAVAMVATANIGVEYTGTMAMDRAMMDRFSMKIQLDYPPVKEEAAVIKHRCKSVKKAQINTVCKLAETQRSMADEGQYTIKISTRMLLDCFEAIDRGMDVSTALKFSILGCFPSEGGESSEQAQVAVLFQKSGLIH